MAALRSERDRHVDSIEAAGLCAYQGAPGAFSEDAAAVLAGPAAPLVPLVTLADVFDAVLDGRVAVAVVPVDNTLAGSVPDCAERLSDRRLEIRSECRIRVAQALIARHGVTLDAITEIYSHPVALDQCRNFLAAHPHIRPTTAFDTAGAVRDVLRSGRLDVAAIAGLRAAEMYGGAILASEVQDRHDNYTRFVLVGRRQQSSIASTG